MPSLHEQPIRRQIFVATGALLLLLAGTVAWVTDRSRTERQQDARQETRTVALFAAAYLDQYFDGLDAAASALVRHPTITGSNAAGSRALLADLLKDRPVLSSAVLRDRNLQIVASGSDIGIDRPEPSAPAYVSDILKTGQPAVGDSYAALASGEPSLGVGYPVRADDGTVAGVLVLALSLRQLQHVFEHVALPDGLVLTVFDRHRRVLVRSRDGERYLGQVIGQTAAGDGRPSAFEVDVDGVPRVVSSVPVRRGPWSLSAGIPRSAVLARLEPPWRRTLTIAILAVFALLALAAWLSHQLSRGLDSLLAAAGRIAEGDLSPPQKARMPNRELSALLDAFVTMAASLRESRSVLARQVEQEPRTRETLQLLQRQVVRQERLAAVGLLVSGVAHELNNPLQAILGTAELVERHPGLSPAVLEEIGLLKTQSGRAREIIRKLSRFASQQSGPPSLVDLRSVIAEVIQLRQHDLETSGIAVGVEASTSRPVYANVTELEQVTLNFVINAQQSIEAAGRGHGRILIRLYDVGGEKVRVDVEDNGTGVSPEDESKLFQPFFTTKPVGKGTGLGLSVSYGIIESYGGLIGCRGNEWRGATFFFDLPAADTAAGGSIAAGRSS